jgi:hypothetical protein
MNSCVFILQFWEFRGPVHRETNTVAVSFSVGDFLDRE